MKIYIVGNPLVPEDCIPLQLIPTLQRAHPHLQFEEADPNDNFIPEEGSIMIDTVKGINTVTLFNSLDSFEHVQSVSPHDYDLGLHLRLLQKLHKITSVTIIGVPQKGNSGEITKAVSAEIDKIVG